LEAPLLEGRLPRLPPVRSGRQFDADQPAAATSM
jgi:hypothetical protein